MIADLIRSIAMNTETEIALLNQKVEQLEQKIDKLSSDVAELVEAWNASRDFLKVVKFVATISTGLIAIFLFVKTGFAGSGK